jgi:hypothetical protein
LTKPGLAVTLFHVKAEDTKMPGNPPSESENGSNHDDHSSEESVKSAQDVFRTLVKAIKNLKLYLPNNPVHQRFLKEFHSKLTGHLNKFGDTVLTVGQYTLTLDDQTVYENINRLDSLAFKLFVDGVRQMTLMEGVSEEESGYLLEVLGRTGDSENSDDDLVTLLWQKNLHHIKFQILEDFFSDLTEGVSIPSPDSKAGFTNLIQSELKNPAESGQAGSMKTLAAEQEKNHQFNQVFRLTEEEIASIKNEMKAETEKDLISEMIEIVYSVLQVEKEEMFFSEMVELLVGNTAHLLEEGDFVQLEKIARLFILLKEQIPPLPETHVAALDRTIDALGKSEYLDKMEKHINTLDDKHLSALCQFLGMLNPSSVPSIINLLGKAKVRKTRKALSDILVEFGKRDITLILARLQGGEWFVIRNLVQIIGQIGNVQAVESLKKLIQYPDDRVRKEVLLTLIGVGKENEKAKGMILLFLNDRDVALRRQALQVIQIHQYEKALPILMKIIAEEDFSSREEDEKHLIFSAIGKLGKPDLIPMFKEFLKPSFFFWIKRRQKEDRALCAVYALKQMETPQAASLLTEAKRHSYKTVGDFASKALVEIQRAKERRELKSKNEPR